MSELNGLRVVVAGAGAIGSVTALMLARFGASVTLADPGRGPNASAVAAGMLAPLSEALFDRTSAGHFPLLKAARDRWDGVLDGLSGAPSIDRSGALIATADPEAALARAAVLGAALRPAPSGSYLFTPEDWRLEPLPMLAALYAAFAAAGGRRLVDEVRLDSRAALKADALILATGFNGGGLTPIKGHILRYPGFGAVTGPVLRAQGVYAAPSLTGLLVGATMEEGVADLAIDPARVAELRAAAERLFPDLVGRPFEASTGVRAATPDGLPIVGPMDGQGVLVARGARRNGWLLAPLIADVIVERLRGGAVSAAAQAFDPARPSIIR